VTAAAEIVCAAEEAYCRCRLPNGHEGLHECRDVENCDGSWGHVDGQFVVGRFPKAMGLFG